MRQANNSVYGFVSKFWDDRVSRQHKLQAGATRYCSVGSGRARSSGFRRVCAEQVISSHAEMQVRVLNVYSYVGISCARLTEVRHFV